MKEYQKEYRKNITNEQKQKMKYRENKKISKQQKQTKYSNDFLTF